MNRRDASKTMLGALLAGSGRVLSQAKRVQAVRVGGLAQLNQVWADLEFQFVGQPCLLVRVPKPQAEHPRFLRVDQQVYLTAYSRVCTHLGCIVPLPDQQQNMECGCHGSRFKADGSLQAGPASQPLRAIRLELREGAVWAVGWLED